MPTSVCELTPPGRGGVATLSLVGDLSLLDRPRPLIALAQHKALSTLHIDRVYFGRWGFDVPEEVVLCRTAGDTLEIHCHGGRAAIQRIISDLTARGAVQEPPSARLSRTQPPLEVECLQALLAARTTRTADFILEQSSGVLRQALDALPRRLETGDVAAVRSQLGELLDWSQFGEHLVRPWSVVLCGRPNVGKSSLVNALAGYTRAIVSDRPGTTRDVVTADVVFDGWPLELSDTAGLHETGDEIEATGIERARSRLAAADLVLTVLDLGQAPTPTDEQLLAEHPGALVVAHKCDLANQWGPRLPAGAVAVSSITGAGLEQLARAMIARLVPQTPPPGTPFPVGPALVAALQQVKAAMSHGDIPTALSRLNQLLLPPQETSPASSSGPH